MRILFLAEALSPHIMRWHNAFKKMGWEVETASCDYDSKFTGIKLKAKVASTPLKYILLVSKLKKLIKDYQPHLINAHFLPSYGLTAALANIHPFALTLWGSDILISGSQGWLRQKRSAYVLNRADLVVADSSSLLDAAKEIAPIKKQLLVSFGVRRSWYESGVARELKKQHTLKIISTRRFEPLYNIQTLIKTVKILKDKKLNFKLTLIGQGSQQDKLHSMVNTLQLNDYIEFKGYVSEEKLFSLLRDSDIYVSTAASDSTSVSLLEAMSQKLFPVVTDIAGNREWLADDCSLFKIGDEVELAKKIEFGFDLDNRLKSSEINLEKIKIKGIREEQMEIAAKTFSKLVDEYHRE